LGKDIEDVIQHDKEDSEAINDAIANNPELKAYLESSAKQEGESDAEKKTYPSEEEQQREANEKLGTYDVVDDDTEFGNNGEEETETTEEAPEESKPSSTNE